ncbi:hypothetical protein NT6N_31030 [Oceaniferula spumae]|uniref:Lipoprotein n=1 Tax=Oceaniferula spumae TaxID=2979115 RepID=A0AAT9FQ02_9BACT
MTNSFSSIKLAAGAVVAALMFANCSTTYDSYGRPVQSVDPVAATAAAVAVGAIAYSAGKNNRNHYHRNYYRGHYRGHHHGHYRGHR